MTEAVLDDFFQLAFDDRLTLQLFHQHGRGIHEARRAVAALEGELVDETLLDRVQLGDLALLVAGRMAFDGPHFLAFEIVRTGDAGAHFFAGAVGVVDDHHAGVTDALAAAEA
ncbi:hypothetical protein D9M73_196250 [compost metagenome]